MRVPAQNVLKGYQVENTFQLPV